MTKTYKREFAVAMVVVTLIFYVAGYFDNYFKEVADLLLTPAMLNAGASFGLDSYAKQVQNK